MGVSRSAPHALPSLARLAADTGGMHTMRTNELSLGYERARDAMSCVYTVGFYVDDYEEDRPQAVSIHVKRDGMRAMHPSRFILRSPEEQEVSALSAAWNAPELFRTGVVRAHVFPLRPSGKEQWEGLLAVRFPVPLDGAAGQASERDFGGVLRQDRKVMHRFNRRVTVRPLVDTERVEPAFTFVDRVYLRPGDYELTVVMSGAGPDDKHAERVHVHVPEVPKKQLMVAGPTLGKAVGDELVVYSEGKDAADDRRAGSGSFTPLLIQYIEEPLDLIFLTDACLVGSTSAVKRAQHLADAVRRDLSIKGDLESAPIPPIPLSLEDQGGRVHCQSIVDLLPSTTVTDGEFVFAAHVVDGQDSLERGEVSFAVDLTTTPSDER